jgi:peptide/nickel transport system ATP-binding protein
MNALNPTRKIIDFIGDVVRAHDPSWNQMIYDHAREDL